MSEPKRYKLRPIFWDYTQKKSVSKDQIDAMGNESAYSHKDGEWVKWEDYDRLKAEVERLTAFTTRTIIPNEELQAENARLKAKVEKLECDAETSYRESMNDEYDLDWLNKINNGLMKEKEKLQAQVERLTKENALATPRSLIASQDIKTLREQIEELKLENSQYEEHHKYGQNVITSLREEVERLTALVESNLNHSKRAMDNSDASVRTLEAQVERLTKAGDAMDNAISEIDPQRLERHRFMQMTDAEHTAVIKWRTAKDPNYNRA
jgi:chromosome segregation ATPase